MSHKKNFPKNHIENPLLTKLVQSRWLDIGLVLFFVSLWTLTLFQSANMLNKNFVNIQPSCDSNLGQSEQKDQLMSARENMNISSCIIVVDVKFSN